MAADSYIQKALDFNPLKEPIMRDMIAALQFPAGSWGLDAGCGIGLQCLLLAEAVDFNGHITGLDISPEFLDRGRNIVKEAGLSERISFQEGDVADLPFDKHTFDWVWSADCVGYVPMEPQQLLKELVRVVKPGGIVAICAWSSENLLPGYPRLEARLRATSAGIAPFVQGKKPEKHFYRALSWFHDLGLKEPGAKVYADCCHAPLDQKIYSALKSLFDMRWPSVENELSSEDATEFRRMCLPDSPDFILNLPDYYAHYTYTLFWGKVA